MGSIYLQEHFVWNAKTQEDMQAYQPSAHNSDVGVMSTGHYTICMLQPPCESKRKERSPKLSEQFEKLLEAKSTVDDDDEEDEDDDGNDTTATHGGSNSNNRKKDPHTSTATANTNTTTPTLTQDIIQACVLWQSLPSSLSGLPSIFEPVQFNPFPDHIPLDDDLKAPAQLLDPLIIERQALCLPSEGFHLLKNLTGDILLSHTQPTCLHTKPDDPSPADLELDRQMLNDDLQTITTQVLAAMDKRLTSIGHLEEQRNRLMGQQCQATVDAFVEKQDLGTFTTLWQQHTSTSMAETIDMVNGYLDDLIKHVQSFLNDFVNPRLVQIGQLIQDLWDLVGPTIQHMAERMATHEERDKGNAENCKAVSQSLKGLHSTKEVDEAIDRIQHAMADRVDEYITSVQELKKTYTAPPSPSSSSSSTTTTAENGGGGGLKSRMDKIQHKEFRKRVKRLESGYTALRQFFRYEVTQKIFPETLFCKFSLVCLGALMQEGEVMEAMIIETEVKRFIESHRPLVKRRQSIVLQYEEGVQVGRRELAGILGKLFLKEGMRIQGENLALKRQAMLLKSMGVPDGGNGGVSGGDGDNVNGNLNAHIGNNGKSDTGGLSKKKKKNKKKKAATAMASASVNTTTDIDDNNDNKNDDEPVAAATHVDVPSSTSTSTTSSSATIATAKSIQLPPPLPMTTAQPSTSSDKSPSSPQIPIKKNKVLTIPPSPASTYVPPPPLTTSTTTNNTASSNKSNATSLKKTKTSSSTPKAPSNNSSTTSANISTPKKNGNIPGATTTKADKLSSKTSTLESSSSSSSSSLQAVVPATVKESQSASTSLPATKATVAKETRVSSPSSPATKAAVAKEPHSSSANQKSEGTKVALKEPVTTTPKTPATASPQSSPATPLKILEPTSLPAPAIDQPKDDEHVEKKEMEALVQQWQQEKQQMDMKMKTLQQDMTTMQQQYMDKIKEQQQQTWQWYEHQQVERKEMQRYIQQLEHQVKQYQQQQQQHSSSTSSSSSSPINSLLMGVVGSSAAPPPPMNATATSTATNTNTSTSTSSNQKPTTPTLVSATMTPPNHHDLSCVAAAAAAAAGGGDPTPSSSSHHWLTAGFGNQDLFAGYRQEMQSSSSSSSSSGLPSLSYQSLSQQQQQQQQQQQFHHHHHHLQQHSSPYYPSYQLHHPLQSQYPPPPPF
ncbi:hypothetical protein BCR42DRAFT_486314 [Absidia repens]|uniref:Uncharacterized protein n=1 Tax=Absidia repens TaxID=90262 RepID=A0A1X2IXD6_9FUNG|nr:hypothetical protein BCR42DRAFT_486314 [Absidia repens]